MPTYAKPIQLIAFILAAALTAACQVSPEAVAEAPESPAPVEATEAATGVDPYLAVAPSLREYTRAFPALALDYEELVAFRAARAAAAEPLPEEVRTVSIAGMNGAPDIELLIIDPAPEATDKPAYLHMHGGGYILGTVRDRTERLVGIASNCECVVVSVDYRLAPETPFPGPMEDNLAALEWLHASVDALGVDASRIAIGGESAGGGHAAQLAIAARDRGIPVAFQVLIFPMLDDRTGSTRDVPGHIGHYVWTPELNIFGWTSYLGQPAGSDTVPYGAVPARVEDLSGLPPTWIGVGSVDLFFGENLDYARRLGEAGVPVEVLVTPGAFHAFQGVAPNDPASVHFIESWQNALKKALAAAPEED